MFQKFRLWHNSFVTTSLYSPIAVRALRLNSPKKMVDLMAELENLEKSGKNRERDRSKEKKKKMKRSDKTVTIASASNPTNLPAELTIDLSSKQEGNKPTELLPEQAAALLTKNAESRPNPPPADSAIFSDKGNNPPPPPDKTSLEAASHKGDGDESFKMEITPSGDFYLKIRDKGETVDSPKPTEQQSPIVNIEDSPEKEAALKSKKRKKGGSAADRLLRNMKRLKTNNKAASGKSKAASLQGKSRENEVSEGLITPSPQPNDQVPIDAHSISVSDLLKDYDSFQKQDERLRTSSELQAANPPGEKGPALSEDATSLKEAILPEVATEKTIPAPEDTTMAGLRFMQVKAERVRDQLARPPPPPPDLLLQGKRGADYHSARFFMPRPRNKSRASVLNPSPGFFPSAAQFSAAKRRQSERSWREQRRKFDTELARRPVRLNSIQTAAACKRGRFDESGLLLNVP